MARPDPAGGRVPEARFELHSGKFDANISGWLVLHLRRDVGNPVVLDPVTGDIRITGLETSPSLSHVDWYLGRRANLDLPPADDGHKPSP
jgi:hypothetical protein